MTISEPSEVIQPSIPDCGHSNEQSAPGVSEAPWALVAHKGGKFGGACIFDIERESVTDFILEFLEGGYTVTPVADRDAYDALCWSLDQNGPLNSVSEVRS